MKRQELADRLGVNSTNTIKNWCDKLGLKVPSDFNMHHVTMFEVYKSLSEKQPKLDDSVIVKSLLPFMQLAKVEPVDPSTHPLTSSGVSTSGAGGGEVENPMIPLVVDVMELAAVELAPVAGAAFMQGFVKNQQAREMFKDCLAASVRGGIKGWLAENVPTITVTSVPVEDNQPLSGSQQTEQKALESGDK